MSDELETNTRVFTLRVWLEEKAEGKRRPKWRGHITNILTGTEQYVEDLDVDEIIQFILSDLGPVNLRISWSWRFLFWLRQKTNRQVTRHAANEAEMRNSKIHL
jgi:hypothetical protein